MLRQIRKEGVQNRLADDSLYIFQMINNEDSAKYTTRFEVYPITQYGTPTEIMKAMENENVLLMELSDDTVVMPRLALI